MPLTQAQDAKLRIATDNIHAVRDAIVNDHDLQFMLHQATQLGDSKAGILLNDLANRLRVAAVIYNQIATEVTNAKIKPNSTGG